jgi:hypothetical protein
MPQNRRAGRTKTARTLFQPGRKIVMTKVCFLLHNSCRSQIAEALGKALASTSSRAIPPGRSQKPHQSDPSA